MRFPQATLLISCLIFASSLAISQFTEEQTESDARPDIPASQPDRRAVWESLIRADNEFASQSRELGMRQAFINHLGEGSVIFRSNGPTDARSLYLESLSARGQQRDYFTWSNQYNDVSVSGDLAVTVGPYMRTSGPFEQERSRNGYLVSIWRKLDNQWRVMAAMAVSIPGVLGLDVEPDYTDTQQVYDEVGDSILALVADAGPLLAADNLFGRSINFRGGRRAILRYGLENQRIYLPGMAPAFGNVAGSSVYGQYLDNEMSTNAVTLNSMGGYLAESGEMGYTYGTMKTSSEHGFEVNYIRVWRLTQVLTDEINPTSEWRIAVEALTPFQ